MHLQLRPSRLVLPRLGAIGLLLLSWAAGPASAGATSATRRATAGLLPVMVLAGQSNMVGWATNVSDLTPTEQMTQTSVLFYGPRDNGTTWGLLTPPTVTTGTLSNNSFGPEISIGEHMVVSGTYDLVAQVKYAVSGTSLAVDWKPDRVNPYLYATLVARVVTATKTLQTMYPDRKVFVAGFFWMQGEQDAQYADQAAAYATNLTNLIEHARADFHSPWLPVFVGRIRAGHFLYADTVRQAEAEVAANMGDVRLVDTDALPMYSDNVHYTSAGVVTLGIDFAASYIVWLQNETHVFLPLVAAKN